MREDWTECTFEDLLDYEQPTKYIVKSTKYSDDYKIPVLTAGKSFIKGYTNETTGIFNDLPTIIFDDFTTATQFVDFEFKVKSSAMKILVPTSKLVNMKFVFNCIQVNQVRNDTHKRYWISVYAKKKILLPPLVMQNAILAKTEEIFSDLDNGIANFKKAQEQLRIYRQAVLKKAFEGELTKKWREKQSNLPTAEELLKQIKEERQNHYNQQIENWKKAVKEWEKNGKVGKKPSKPKKTTELTHFSEEEIKKISKLPIGWKWIPFFNIGYWTGGGTPSKAVNEFWTNGNVLWITSKDMKSKIIYDTIDKITVDAVEKSSAKMIEKGSVLFVMRSGILRRILPVAITNTVATVNQDLQALTPYLVNSNFIYWYSISNEYDIRKECAKDGTTVESVESTLLKRYPFSLCSLQEQTQIVQEIESRLSVCDKMEQSISESIEKAEALRQSILKKAFEGKLLSQAEIEQCKHVADYEPASELLKKIKAEKLAKEQEKKKETTKKKSKK